MKIALFGAGGRIGRAATQEALARGHKVTAVVRDPARFDLSHDGLTVAVGDVTHASKVASVAAGHDVVVSAIGPRAPGNTPRVLVKAARSLIQGLTKAGIRRLVVVGGAGSLEVAPGVQLMDTPDFPASWKDVAAAHRDALDVYKKTDLDWTCISPAALIELGERTGRYRTGTDRLLTDAKGESRISIEDYAVALIDEVENPKFNRRRMTVAY
jgi:putative NADH-flavin reductase